MKNAWYWLLNIYQTNPLFRALVQAAEGGAFTGFVVATSNGFDLSKKGMVALAAGVIGGAVTAIRNYFKNRIGQPEMPGPQLPPPTPIDAPKAGKP